MSALWFYEPQGCIMRSVYSCLGRTTTHIGIQHAVADVSVVTEAHPWRGVYCMPMSSVKPPQKKIFMEVPDLWVTAWLARRWGVRFSFLDRAAHHTSCLSIPLVTSATLAVEMIRDARRDGHGTPGTPTIDAVDSAFVTPSMLAEALKD